ncbi:hypothetical protein MASR2M39_26790 [Ignavibacteriales bacterium]
MERSYNPGRGELRIESDDEDFFYLGYEEAKESVEDAERFIKSITAINS